MEVRANLVKVVCLCAYYVRTAYSMTVYGMCVCPEMGDLTLPVWDSGNSMNYNCGVHSTTDPRPIHVTSSFALS